ncbi:transcription initiation factor TFIID subunit 5-like [Styela clava]
MESVFANVPALPVKMEVTECISTTNETKVTETPTNENQKTLLAVLQFLKKNNLGTTAAMLEKESSKLTGSDGLPSDSKNFSTSDVSSLLSTYSNQADPSSYQDSYRMLKQFIESNLDSHKWELAQVLYPVFVHMYLELLYNNHAEKAKLFFLQYSGELEDFHEEDLIKLSTMTKKEHMEGNELMRVFHSSEFVIKMSRDSFQMLKRYLQDKNLPMIMNIVQDHIFIDVYDGLPRTKKQIHSTAGGMGGEAKREENKIKVLYGLLKEPDIDITLDDDDEMASANDSEQTEGSSKPKKKKKREILSRKNKADPNAPALTRIPLPEMKDADKLEKISAIKESLKRVRLGGPDLVVPSICCYTFTNAFSGVTAINISDDSSLLAAGFQDSYIRVWSLTPHSLRNIKVASELSALDKESDDILDRMMDDKTASDCRTLLGHTGVVYAVGFSPCREYLISSSEDATVRLWSLLTWTNLVVYKGHVWSVWGAVFGPHGHYFASAGQDRVARLWSTDHHQPLRIFAGHLSDVECVLIHPNSNYTATGSSDRSVRVWDNLNGNCVRVYTGHKGNIMCLAWSPDGKYLASGGSDNQVLVWDIPNKVLIAEFTEHTSMVCAICFSRDGEVLASAGTDNTVKIWDIQKAISDIDTYDINLSHGHVTLPETTNYLLASVTTKSTPLLHLHFTRRNLLLAVGIYTPTVT